MSVDAPPSDDDSPAHRSHSRPSKTNRAGSENARQSAQRRAALRKPLTERDGIRLRSDVRQYGAEEGARPKRWGTALASWRDYIEDKAHQGDLVLQDSVTGDEAVIEASPHRFDPAYSNKQYAKLKDLERGVRARYGRSLHTAMLTLTASSTDDDGDPLPPVDHLNELDSSWEAVRRALSRSMGGRRWEYLAILEPHQSGYLHLHVAVFVDGAVCPEEFRPVIEAHLRNCELAGREAHDLDHDDEEKRPVSVKRVGSEREEGTIGNLGTYLAEYLGCYGDDPQDAPSNQQMANTVLWATGKQRWRPSQGAQGLMATDSSEGRTDWEVVAVEKIDGERVPVTPGGGVDTFETASFDTDTLPPPG